MRVAVFGGGFTQFASPAAALKSTTLAISNLQVESDSQMTMTVTAPAAGDHVLSLGTILAGSASAATVKVAAADPYVASFFAHGGDVNGLAHDPVRQAVYALDYYGNAVYRFQYASNAWSAAALPVASPNSLTLSPDGSRVLVQTVNSGIVDVDPVAWKIRSSYSMPTGSSVGASDIAVSGDNRLWVPGSFTSSPQYIDLATNTIKSATDVPPSTDGSAYYASADGTKVLVSPSYAVSPRNPWRVYLPANGTIGTVDGGVDLWYGVNVSADGKRMAIQGTGATYDAAYQLIGQPPRPTGSAEFYSRTALAPDGTRIVALVHDGFTPVRFDIFSTTPGAGTTNFARVGSIPITTSVAKCANSSDLSCNFVGRILVSLDGATLFWVGNQGLQAFKLP